MGQHFSALVDILFNLVHGYEPFLIGLGVICVVSFLIVREVRLANRRRDYTRLIKENTQRLRELARDRFVAQACSRCYESEMSIEYVSPNGRSIRCRCLACGESQIAQAAIEAGFEASSIITTLLGLREDYNLLTSRRSIESLEVHFAAPEASLPYQQTKEPIPESIQSEVWSRDGGRCVKCGSQDQLEFDHIIPVSKGGATSVRNLQLLCQRCNRSEDTARLILVSPVSAQSGT